MDALVDSNPESKELFDDNEGGEDGFPPPPSPLSQLTSSQGGISASNTGQQQLPQRIGGRSFHDRDLSDFGGPDDDDDTGRRIPNRRRDEDDTLSDGNDSPRTEHDSLSQAEDDEDDEDDDKKSDHSSGEDYSDDEDEGEDGYRPGGYHRVSVGETYNQRYVVQGWCTVMDLCRLI